ncbi:MAG: hypothetical protein ABL929_10840 [Ferruginibacter sp.]|nr:hypothetical protein [Ferruginibacter sp.]
MKTKLFYITILTTTILLQNCANKNEKKLEKIDTTIAQKETETIAKPQKAVVINLADTIENKWTVLCFKDSSKTEEGMVAKLTAIYNTKLPEAIKANKLKIMGSPMAWHTMQKTAYFFEAGIPVDKAPTKITKGIYTKNTGTDSAYVAHFFGPTNLTKGAYQALQEKLTENHKIKSNNIYEVYIGNPFQNTTEALDAYKLQTDIILPFKKQNNLGL